jgi:bifunctional non-homologous end joining protein LigD
VQHIEPCTPKLASKPPAGPQWTHEIKHDGYRLIARKQGDRLRLFTRRGYDWSDRYPRIVEAVEALPTGSATIDGEASIATKAALRVSNGSPGPRIRSQSKPRIP